MLGGEKMYDGRALEAKDRPWIFNDQQWEDLFDEIVKLTPRKSVIRALTGTDLSDQRLRDLIDNRREQFNLTARGPRGVAQKCTSEGFLDTSLKRFDAALLVALHYGAAGPGPHAPVETHFRQAAAKRVQVYNTYKSIVFADGGEPRLSFETYLVLLDGIRCRDVSVHHCDSCSARYVWPPSATTQPTCPVCQYLHLEKKDTRRAKMPPPHLVAVANAGRR